MASSRWMVRLLLVLCLVHHLPAVYVADLYVCPGASVTLPCDGGTDKDTNEVDVLWKLANKLVCWFKNGTWCEHPHFVNRTQLGSIRQNNFSLVINPARLQDQGEYTCQISRTSVQINRLFVRGGRKRRAAETPPEGSLVCKPYKDVPGEKISRDTFKWTLNRSNCSDCSDCCDCIYCRD